MTRELIMLQALIRTCTSTTGKILHAALCVLASFALSTTHSQSDFIAFESGPVRPVALSPDGATLFVTNIPDNRLELLDISGTIPLIVGSVPVGLEPVAVAVLDEHTVFVANHLSDSVSVIRLTPVPHVKQTLLVGDEPRDLVIADPDLDGPLHPRLFVTTAHRGQHRDHESLDGIEGTGDPQLTEASIPRADVWVFDTGNLGSNTLGGEPLKIVELFSDTPRALAVSNNQSTVYAAAHFSGNQSTVVHSSAVCNGFTLANSCQIDGIETPGGIPNGLAPGGNPGPNTNIEGIAAPEVALIVKWNATAGQFQDELGRNWNNAIRFRLPDKDVFAIDTLSLEENAVHTGVGTTLFNMAVHPTNGGLYISNTEAINEVRFEGPGEYGGSTVQGHLAETRLTVIPNPDSSASTVLARHLNKHIDYSQLPAPAAVREASLSTPLQLVFSPDGTTIYLAAYGSDAIAVLPADRIADDSFTPVASNKIPVSGGGPAGIAIDTAGEKLYVYTRFDNGVSVIDTESRQELSHMNLFNPEPDSIVNGRPFLYNAEFTSSNGEASCASCHIFGDTDHLAWDLGNPDDHVKLDPIPTLLGIFAGNSSNGGAGVEEFHPMKGPMTTQTLRGLENSGAMHWRGDRSNGILGIDAVDEDLSFRNFIEAFSGLLGREENIPEDDMQAFADFQLQVFLPPNPVRALDNSLTDAEQRGANFFDGPRLSDGITVNTTSPNLLLRTGFTCEGCHEHDPAQGFFGTGTNQSFEGGGQIVKIPHFRNLYTKIGMFGMPRTPGITGTDNSFMGDQIRGFGFTHAGTTDTLLRFFNLSLFQAGGTSSQVGFTSSQQHADMERFMLAFDTDLAPVVGQQVTYTNNNEAESQERVQLLLARAESSFVSKSLGGQTVETDVIAHSTVDGIPRSWAYMGNDEFLSDLNETYSLDELQCLAHTDNPVTFSAVPPGTATRMALDRNRDGVFNGVESGALDLVRSTTTPVFLDDPERLSFCQTLKVARTATNARFDCDSGMLEFPVTVDGAINYSITMQLISESPIQFELIDAVAGSAAADNMATFSAQDGLRFPMIHLSCSNVVPDLQFNLVQEQPVIFQFATP